ncbi:MAG: RloB domain-containing protein [Pseudomonadota bacterium]|nr:RloB domain-containing protein [Pseudomonadota bacterium]
MGKDNQPKVRQSAQLARKVGRRAGYDRILIVTEGSKTEPLYLGEIRKEFRLQTANVQVQHSQLGTSPIQVVEYAEHLFVNGDRARNIQPRVFEQVHAVFDRDDHESYHDALAKAAALNGRLLNDVKQKVKFLAITSVPCFELWLLLHFEDVLAPLHRTDVYRCLRQYLIDYDKGLTGHYAQTCQHLDVATQRAKRLAERTTAYDGVESFTDMHRLVHLLTTLKT